MMEPPSLAPSIALRIAWTSGQLWPAGVKVLLALASCGDFDTGRRCFPRWKTLVARSGLSRATVARTLVRLKDRKQPGGPWIVATWAGHRHSTTYDIVVERLATRPPKEQQVNLQPLLAAPEFESQFETQNRSESHNETQDPEFESQIETPTGTPDLDQERTHTPRAREDVGQTPEVSAPDPELALLGQTPPPRCQHPHVHAWCEGRVHVPRDLHFEFLDKLGTRPGESRGQKAGRLVNFYADTMHHLSPEADIGDSYAFWKAAFAAWVGSGARRRGEPKRRPDIENSVCPHAPRCPTFSHCIARTLDDGRAARERKQA